MSEGKLGHLWFASIAVIVGSGGLLEHRSQFSLLSAILGMGLGIWLQWVVERSRKKMRDRSDAAER
jgi:hypothetical protein